MKRFDFDISPSVIDVFFPTYRIKNKTQILRILLEAIRYSISYNTLEIKNPCGKVVLVIDKMSRIFFTTANKSYSISFPFFATENDGGLQYTFESTLIDSYFISNLITVIASERFMDGSSIDFSEALIDYEAESAVFWDVLRELLLYEDGYVRYDCDKEGYDKAKEKGQEHRHPLHHFDLFYTSKASFKLGLENEFVVDEFVDVMNIQTDCKYLKNWR